MVKTDNSSDANLGRCESGECIVTSALKVDFHIHSSASAHKDGKKVKENSIENIDDLISGLVENGVNMCAITDHDVFDPVLYQRLKVEEAGANCIKKVLPGVEFTVSFSDIGGRGVPVHVVTIFDDTEKDITERIVDAIPIRNGKPDYDDGSSFSEQRYWDIIRDIDASVVLIAHQKNSLNSPNGPKKDDANSVGEEGFNEFLFMDYFEAYEYKNRKNEIHNKNYVYETDTREKLRFITGTDCHSWSLYPYTKGETAPYAFTYLRCLPTFKGLAMGITDAGRIRLTDNFFGAGSKTLKKISLNVNGSDITIPLSPGINAIIGDNSIGKSLLISKLASYERVDSKKKSGYETYLAKNNVVVRTVIPSDDLYKIDYQGDIRRHFEELSGGRADSVLAEHFPDPVDPSPYIEKAKIEIGKYIAAVRRSVEYQEKLSSLGTFAIPPKTDSSAQESVKFTASVKKGETKGHSEIVNGIRAARASLRKLQGEHKGILEQEDLDSFKAIEAELKSIEDRHQSMVEGIERENAVIGAVNASVSEFKKAARKRQTDSENVQQDFLSDKTLAVDQIADLVVRARGVKPFRFDFELVPITPNKNPVGRYVFVSKLGERELSSELLEKAVSKVHKSGRSFDMQKVTEKELEDTIVACQPGTQSLIDYYESRIVKELESLLSEGKAIIRDGDDVFSELSQGYNAQIYFALLTDMGQSRGVYLVDQPEDQISQKAIKRAVLEDFRDLAQYRQVILVTHNPQFLINLDVDNVIFLSRGDDGQLKVQYGALEYECEDYKILDIVAENIDGGLETIKKRMKRYEKAY